MHYTEIPNKMRLRFYECEDDPVPATVNALFRWFKGNQLASTNIDRRLISAVPSLGADQKNML